MVFKVLYILVLWIKVASSLEGLMVDVPTMVIVLSIVDFLLMVIGRTVILFCYHISINLCSKGSC